MKVDKTPRPKSRAEREATQRAAGGVGSPAPAAPLPPQLTRWQRRAQWLRGHPFVVFMEAIGLVGLIFAVGLFVYELRERQDERIARAWQLLTTPAAGNSGKREALEYLNSQYGCYHPVDFRFKERTPYLSFLKFVELQQFFETNTVINLGSYEVGFLIEKRKICWKERISLTGNDLTNPIDKTPVFLEEVELPNAELTYINWARSDMERSNLSGANLFRATMIQADLTRTNMSGADLTAADFSEARLNSANLVGANLRGANMTRVHLSGADLSGAQLSSTILSFADLSGTKLTGANLSYAKLDGANLSKADLTGVEFEGTNLSTAWVFDYAPANGVDGLPFGDFATRMRNEPWNNFVDRIMRERPELGWTERMKKSRPRQF